MAKSYMKKYFFFIINLYYITISYINIIIHAQSEVMEIRKLIFFVLIKGYAKVVNMYFLIARSYREQNC